MKTKIHCSGYEKAKVSRREFLGSGLSGAAGMMLGAAVNPLPSWLPKVALADPQLGPRGDTLVCIFLRGGADGLNIVVPHGDESYYEQRPTIAIPRPDQLSLGLSEKTLDLNGFFGLHPALEPLQEIYAGGDLACVQATGSPDETRSHFEAMELMERGAVPGEHSGWLTRHLATLDTGNQSALRAVAVGDMLPYSLSGMLNATALQSVSSYHLKTFGEDSQTYQSILQEIYGRSEHAMLKVAAEQTFETLALMEKIHSDTPANEKAFGDHDFGRAMQTVAQLIHADAGVEVACVDLGGWDTHISQGGSDGYMARQLAVLAEGVRAFYDDLGEKRNQVTVMIMSEFGRRIGENAGAGTDHGHGNMMMVLGDGINGGQVIADWPGLHPDVQTGPGDLEITIDYRDILGEVLERRLNNPQLEAVFSGYQVKSRGIVTLN